MPRPLGAIFDKVAILGVGLVGGSLGMGLRKKGLARRVVGWGRHAGKLRRAVALGAVDEGTRDLACAVRDADLVVLASPVSLIPALARRAAPHLRGSAIVTDVGSSKAWIARELGAAFSKKVSFVGAHPFAGSERTGVEAAAPDLFKGHPCFLVWHRSSDLKAMNKLRRMWEALDARVVEMGAAEHDRLVAGLSHLPHLAAAGLVLSARAEDLRLASTGFRDTTRIAGGDPALWRDILLSNRAEVLKSLERYARELSRFKRALKRRDAKELAARLSRAQRRRRTLS